MHKLFNRLGLLLVATLSSFSINAQALPSFVIEITDSKKEKIPGAIVHIDAAHFVSDDYGYAIIPWEHHQSNIAITSIGFEPYELKAHQIKVGDTIKVILTQSRYSLDQVEIAGHRQWESSLGSIENIEKDDLNKKTGLNLGSIIEGVRGVHLLKTGATIEKPIVHGLHSNRVAVINNGVKQKGQEWGAEHAPEIDPYSAGEIKVIKGAESVKYGGEAMGGAILISPPTLRMDTTIYGSLRLASQSNGRSISGALKLGGHHRRLPHLSWMIQASAKKSGNLKTADYYLENSGVQETNAHAYLNYTREHFQSNLNYSLFHTDLGILTSSHIGSLEDLLFHIGQGRPIEKGAFSYKINAPRQNINHHLVKWRNHIHLSDYAHLTVQYSFQWNQRKEFDIRRADRSSTPSIDLSLKAHDLSVQLEWTPHSNFDFDFGIFGAFQDNENIPGTFTTPLIPDYIQQEVGLYALGNWNHKKWRVQGGVRGDLMHVNALGYNYLGQIYGEEKTYGNISGTLAAEYQINGAWQVTAITGSAWRPPHVNELYSTGLHHGSAAFELGDEFLNPEQSWKNLISIKWRPYLPFSIEIEAFSHLINDYIYLSPTQEYWESLRGIFPIFQYQQTKAHLYGLDFLGKWHITNTIDYSVQASLIKAKDLTNQSYLPQIPAHQLRQSLSWSIGQWKNTSTPYVKLEHVWMGKQNDYHENLDFVAPPNAYHLLNASIGAKWHLKKQVINVDLSVQNLTNQLYKDYLNRFRYYTHDLGRSIQLRINYEF